MTHEHRSRGRRRLFRVAVAVVVAATIAVTVLAVVSLQAPRMADAHPEAVSGGAVTSTAFLAGCGSTAVVAPLTIPIWCSSSDQSLDDLTWSSWGGAKAEATGDLLDRPCTCAGGAFDHYPVRATLSSPSRVSGTWRYSQLTLTFPAGRPDWAFRPTFGFVWTAEGFVSKQDNA